MSVTSSLPNSCDNQFIFPLFVKQKSCQLLVKNCLSSLFYISVNEICFGFGLLVKKNKQFEDVILAFGKLWKEFFFIIWQLKQQWQKTQQKKVSCSPSNSFHLLACTKTSRDCCCVIVMILFLSAMSSFYHFCSSLHRQNKWYSYLRSLSDKNVCNTLLKGCCCAARSWQ